MHKKTSNIIPNAIVMWYISISLAIVLMVSVIRPSQNVQKQSFRRCKSTHAMSLLEQGEPKCFYSDWAVQKKRVHGCGLDQQRVPWLVSNRKRINQPRETQQTTNKENKLTEKGTQQEPNRKRMNQPREEPHQILIERESKLVVNRYCSYYSSW